MLLLLLLLAGLWLLLGVVWSVVVLVVVAGLWHLLRLATGRRVVQAS